MLKLLLIAFYHLPVACIQFSVTPADYEPPGFQAAALSDFSFRDDPLSIKVGDVETVRLAGFLLIS